MPRLLSLSGQLFFASLSPAVTFGARFARNIILSRFLDPSEFGTAIAISAVLLIGELATDMALDRFVIIHDDKNALGAAHVLALIRSALIAIILVATAPLAADWFGVSKFAGSFMVAGSLSIFGGMYHLGVKQVQRNFSYGPEALARFISGVAATLALIPAIAILHDHNVIIVSYVTEIISYALLSHILAPTRYTLLSHGPTISKALGFGLPLTLNGVGLSIIYQFDRFMVGYWFGVVELAKYTVVTSLAVVPTNLILGSFSNFGLSFLLSGQETSGIQFKRFDLLIGIYSTIAVLYVFGTALTLNILTSFIFGASFTPSPYSQVLYCAIAALRLQRGGAPTTLLLAGARTRRLAYLTLTTALGYVAAWVMIIMWRHLESMLIGIAVGEFISLLVSFSFCRDQSVGVSQIAEDVARTVLPSAIIVLVLALSIHAYLATFLTVIIAGLIVIPIQIGFELHRNKFTLRSLITGLHPVPKTPS